jgi:uncharacterized membrane protein
MSLKGLLMRAARHGTAQVLGVILFLGGAGIGLSLLSAPDTFLNYQMLATNFLYVSPVAWGVIFLVASTALVISVLVEPSYAQLPALMLGGVFIVFGLLSLANGISPLVWAFVALGWISIFTQVICWAEEKRETLYHYQPH